MSRLSANEKSNFSIWDSVVNDKIIQYEKLERKYQQRNLRLNELTDENGILKEKLEKLEQQILVLDQEKASDKQLIADLKNESQILKQWVSNMENSTSWKITKPVRMILDKVKGGN